MADQKAGTEEPRRSERTHRHLEEAADLRQLRATVVLVAVVVAPAGRTAQEDLVLMEEVEAGSFQIIKIRLVTLYMGLMGDPEVFTEAAEVEDQQG